MAFTGDLENLPFVDIIQLIHTTRKSGIFSVKAGQKESNIVFSNGYIVGANHVNDSIRIGTVLVRSGAITTDELRQAFAVMRDAAPQDRRPLLSTLVQKGMLQQEDAQKGLRKLVEITIVELMSWTKGTFTFDTEAAIFSAEGGGSSDGLEQDVVLDAQMVLMDALRIFDERERDRASGKEVPSFEELYPEVLPEERLVETPAAGSAITADVLGLADIERLEKKVPRPVSEMETFDPVEIHRQKIKELLAGFSSEEQEAFVAFLKKSVGRKPAPEDLAKQAGKAVVFYSGDRLLKHAVMTVCNEQGVPVFATDGEKELEQILAQCLSAMRMPAVVLDGPAASEDGLPEDQIVALRGRVREKYSAVPLLQLASPLDSNFILQSYNDGVRAVLPRPLKEVRRETYVQETIQFLVAFTSYIKSLQSQPETTDRFVKELKKDVKALREIVTPSDAALVLLIGVADMFERAITFMVRPPELVGERSIGVTTEKSMGPTQAMRLKIPLGAPSIFQEVIEKEKVYYGESRDETVKVLFQQIGAPLSPSVVLVPLISDRKVVAVVYGDFGKNEVAPVQLDILEILAQQVGISLEYALYRRQMAKASQKT